jgi:phosphoglycolate phosphatase-like HAD superfamily hydrolase
LIRGGARPDVRRVWDLKREGCSTEQALTRLGLEAGLAREVTADWRRMIEEPCWLGLDSVLPGVRAALEAMRAAGWELWLLTARSRPEWVKPQLAHLGLAAQLDQVAVVSAQNAAKAKAAMLQAAGAVAFFGDTESDHQAARSAAVSFYAVGAGQRSAACLERNGVGRVHGGLRAAWDSFLEGRTNS